MLRLSGALYLENKAYELRTLVELSKINSIFKLKKYRKTIAAQPKTIM